MAEKLSKIDSCGIGGVMMTFKMGPMPFDLAAHSISLFMRQVAPHFPSHAQQFAGSLDKIKSGYVTAAIARIKEVHVCATNHGFYDHGYLHRFHLEKVRKTPLMDNKGV